MDETGLTALILLHKADVLINASIRASNQGFRDLWAAKAALLIGAVKRILGGEE